MQFLVIRAVLGVFKNTTDQANVNYVRLALFKQKKVTVTVKNALLELFKIKQAVSNVKHARSTHFLAMKEAIHVSLVELGEQVQKVQSRVWLARPEHSKTWKQTFVKPAQLLLFRIKAGVNRVHHVQLVVTRT